MSFDRLLEREFPGAKGKAELQSRVAEIRAAAELTSALDQLRVRRHISKARLAAAIGRQPSVLSRLFRSSKANPTVETVLEVVDAMGVYLKVEVVAQPERADHRHAPIEITLPDTSRREVGRMINSGPVPAV